MWKSTLWITVCSLASIILSFLLQVMLAARFGATGVMDAYLVASTLPTLLLGLLPGALNICLIPVFVEYTTKNHQQEAFAISNGVIVLFGLTLGGVVLAGEFAAPWIIKGLAPGFDAVRLTTALKLFRILLPTLMLYGVASVLGSVYYAQRKPFWPALSPVLRISGMLLGVTVGKRWGIFALAWGDLLGTGLSLIVLSLNYFRTKNWRFWQGLWTPGIRRVVVLVIPWLAGFAVSKANPVVERFLASSLPEGNITYLGYAYQIVTLIVTIMTKGLSLSLFPILSAKAANGDLDGLRQLIGRGIRGLLLIIIPVIVLVVLYGQLGIQVVFERGAFDAAATRGTYWVLLGYLGTLVALPMGMVITNTFYAFQDTRTVARVAVAGFALNVVLDLLLVRLVGTPGLAIGYSVVALFNMFILYIILARRIGRGDLWRSDLLAVIIGAGLAGILSRLSTGFAQHIFSGIWKIGTGEVETFSILSIALSVFGVVYVAINYAMGNREIRMAFRRIRSKRIFSISSGK